MAFIYEDLDYRHYTSTIDNLQADHSHEVEIVSASESKTVTGHMGGPLLAHRTYREVRKPIDTLLVAGGDGPREMRYAPEFIRWLKKQSTKVRRLATL